MQSSLGLNISEEDDLDPEQVAISRGLCFECGRGDITCESRICRYVLIARQASVFTDGRLDCQLQNGLINFD